MRNHWSRVGLTVDTKAGPVWTGELRFNREWLYQPLSWRSSTAVFVCAHSDLFHEDVADEWLDEIHGVMASCPHHLFLVLTKRSARARAYYSDPAMPGRVFPHWQATGIKAAAGGKAQRAWPRFPDVPLRNLWLGASVEDQIHAHLRLGDLVNTPAALHWVSVEPMLGAVDLRPWLPRPGLFSGRNNLGLQLVIAGGESQRGARWLPSQLVRDLRDQVVPSGAVFHFKQFGAWLPRDQVITDRQFEAWRKRTGILPGAAGAPMAAEVGPAIAGHLLDGVEHRGMPHFPGVFP